MVQSQIGDLAPDMQLKLVGLRTVFIEKQTVVGISAVMLVVLYRHLGINLMHHVAIKYDVIHNWKYMTYRNAARG